MVAGLLAGAVAARAERVFAWSLWVCAVASPPMTDRHDFHQAELFGNWNLPWGWDLGKEWHLQSRLDLSAGWLGDRSQNAAIGTLGPTLVLSRARLAAVPGRRG